MKVLVARLCLTLCDPMDCSPAGSSVCGILQARIVEWVAILFFQGIFPTQELNPGVLHNWQILYCLSHQGNPRILEWVAYPFLQGIFPTQELNQGLLHYRLILYQLSYQESPVSTIKYLMNTLWNFRIVSLYPS